MAVIKKLDFEARNVQLNFWTDGAAVKMFDIDH